MEDRDGLSRQDDRESIWSVDRRTKTLYFALFIVQSIIGIGALAWHTILQGKGPLETAVAVWQGSALIIAASAGTSVIIAESWGSLMVLARSLEEWLERRREKHDARVGAEALAEGRAEALAEAETRWMGWNNRRIAAEENNKPFDEHHPTQSNKAAGVSPLSVNQNS